MKLSSRDHNLIVLSSEPLAILFKGSNSRQLTDSSCWPSVWMNSPVFAFHSLTVLSFEPLINIFKYRFKSGFIDETIDRWLDVIDLDDSNLNWFDDSLFGFKFWIASLTKSKFSLAFGRKFDCKNRLEKINQINIRLFF